MVHTISLKELRPDLPRVVDSIDGKLDRYVITKRGKPVVVMLNIEDYESLMETLDILADRETMTRIKLGKEEARKRKTRSWKDIKNSVEKL